MQRRCYHRPRRPRLIFWRSYFREDARPPLRPARLFCARDPPRLLLRVPVLRRERLLPLVSPFFRRVLFTGAAAIRFAVPLLRPRFFAELLMCSYCLSRLLLQAFGIPCSFRARRRKPLRTRA